MRRKQDGGGEQVGMVAFNGERVSVEFTIPNGVHREARALTNCPDKPEAPFVVAFEALREHGLKIARIPGGTAGWTGARVTKVHVSYDKHGRRSFVLTVQNDLEHGCVVLNTPTRMERLDRTEIGAGFATDEMRAAIEAVCAQGLRYYGLSRVQGELFDKDGAATDEQPGDVKAERAAAKKRAAKKKAKR